MPINNVHDGVRAFHIAARLPIKLINLLRNMPQYSRTED